MKKFTGIFLGAMLAAKAHGYVAIVFTSCYNLAGSHQSTGFLIYPQPFDDSPMDDTVGQSCDLEGAIGDTWTCSVGGYTGTVESTTGGCRNQLTLEKGTITKDSTGEVVDPFTDTRCEVDICNEDHLCTHQRYRCEI